MKDFGNLADLFFQCASSYAEQNRYRVKRGGEWIAVGWKEHEQSVLEIAAGLIDLGFQAGEKIAILSDTRPEWIESDFGILATGGVSIPIYASNLPDECGYILHNSESAACFVENEVQLAKIREVLANGFELEGQRQAIDLRAVFVLEGESDGDRVTSVADLRARGRRVLDEGPAVRSAMDERVRSTQKSDLATIVYTSGTTGPPKGVPQTHGNHLATMAALEDIGFGDQGDVEFLFLPLAHSFARANQFYGTMRGFETAFAQSIPTVSDDIRESQPMFVPSVPRIFEKIYARIQSRRAGMTGAQAKIFDWALAVGKRKSACEQRGQDLPFVLSLQAGLADRLVFGKIRDLLGGRVRYMISGGAPLSREIQELFHALGILVLEGYGLTETTPILTANRPDAYRFGSVGKAIAGVTLRIADDGEILAKGPNVAAGYYKRPEATAEAWDADGWFHTGDIGEIDGDGFLAITDRKKDLMKTSGGKYIAPQKIENFLKTQPHVSQAVAIGDNRKYVTALVTLDPEAMAAWSEENGCDASGEALASDERVVAMIANEVEATNAKLASFESIQYFRILPIDFSPESGELTPSLKVKRKVVNDRYSSVIESMYDGT